MSTECIENPDPALDPKRFASVQIRQLMPHFRRPDRGRRPGRRSFGGHPHVTAECLAGLRVIILTGQKTPRPRRNTSRR